MLYRKIFTFFLIILFVGNSLAQTAAKTDVKKPNISPELQEKTKGLLNDLAREAEQFSLPYNRVNARILIASLLWESDEKQARAVFQSAISELIQIIGQIPAESPEAEEEYNTQRYLIINDAKTLRNDLLLAIASRDPAFALEALQSLSQKKDDGVSIFDDEKTLELSLAGQIAVKDPKRAYELAKKNLDENINHNVFSTLESLYEKDAELGAKLAQDIAGKIKSKDTKIVSPNDYAGNTNSMVVNSNMMTATVSSAGFTVNLWEIQAFLDSVKKLNQKATKNKKPILLSENDFKEVIDVLAQMFIKQQYLSSYEVAKSMPEITKYFPAQAIAIKRKLGEGEATTLNDLVKNQSFQNEIEGKTADEILQAIEKKPAAERDNLYWKAAEQEFTQGNAETAKKFYAKIKTKPEYDYLGKGIDGALPLAMAEKGELGEVREMLGKLKTPEERIEVLTTLAISTAKSGDKKSASALLGEARSTYSGKMKNRKNLTSVLQFAQAYAVIEADQAFVFLENNVSFFNDLISAAIMLDEFNEGGAAENEELRLDAVKRVSYANMPKGVALLRNLATADFDRTSAFTEKFARPEVRFFARYRIAESLLDSEAEANEKAFQTSMESEHHDH